MFQKCVNTRILKYSATVINNVLPIHVLTDNLYSSGVFATRAYSDHFPIFNILRNTSIVSGNKIMVDIHFSF